MGGLSLHRGRAPRGVSVIVEFCVSPLLEGEYAWSDWEPGSAMLQTREIRRGLC